MQSNPDSQIDSGLGRLRQQLRRQRSALQDEAVAFAHWQAEWQTRQSQIDAALQQLSQSLGGVESVPWKVYQPETSPL